MTQIDNNIKIDQEKGDQEIASKKNSSTVAVQQSNTNVVSNSNQNAPERTGLHLLQTEWTLWLYTNNKAKSWDENLQKVISFNVVEDFWAVYNHIQLASKLNAGHDYALFRAGTRPAWEDEANKVGGRWIVSLPSKHYRKNDLDRLWLEVILLIIGEDFQRTEESSLIVGAVVSIRFKDDRIALWTADADKTDCQKAVGKQLRERFGLPPEIRITYEAHMDQTGPKSKRGPRYEV